MLAIESSVLLASTALSSGRVSPMAAGSGVAAAGVADAPPSSMLAASVLMEQWHMWLERERE